MDYLKGVYGAAFAAGLAFVLVGQVGRLVISQTPQWMTFAKWLVGQ